MAIKSKVALVTAIILVLTVGVVTLVVSHLSHGSATSATQAAAFEEVYGLKGQSVRRVAPPFAAVRTDFILSENPSLAHTKYGLPVAMIVNWKGGKPRLWGFTQSIPPHKYTVAHVIHDLWLSPEWSLEGDETLKTMDIEGDLIVDAASNSDQRRAAIERILSEQVGSKITVRFREVSRPVIVFKGTWNYTPAVPIPQQGSRSPGGPPRMELFVTRVKADASADGVGTLDETVIGISDELEKTVLFECQGAPGQLVLHSSARAGDKPADSVSRNAAIVVKHLEEQTGLTATEEMRSVRRLFVERG